jgi:hypothetical protein
MGHSSWRSPARIPFLTTYKNAHTSGEDGGEACVVHGGTALASGSLGTWRPKVAAPWMYVSGRQVFVHDLVAGPSLSLARFLSPPLPPPYPPPPPSLPPPSPLPTPPLPSPIPLSLPLPPSLSLPPSLPPPPPPPLPPSLPPSPPRSDVDIGSTPNRGMAHATCAVSNWTSCLLM